MKKIVAYTIGAGLAGTSMGFHLSGDFGAMIGATAGVVIGFAWATWDQIPR